MEAESNPNPNANPLPGASAEADAALQELATMVTSMLAQRDVFQSRARAWIASPGFNEVYEDAHPRLLFKIVATLFGSGKSFKMGSEKVRAGYRRLATEGELLFAGGIIVNPVMSRQPYERYPAAVIASPDQDLARVMQIGVLGLELGKVYRDGRSESKPQCQRLLADDTYQPFRQRRLPAVEIGGVNASLYDVRFSAAEMMLDEDAYPFIPLLIHPAGGQFIVVPWAILHGRPLPSRDTAPSLSPPPLPKQGDVSPGGSTFIRHKAPESDFVPADMSGEAAGIISPHVEKYIGKIGSVFHELISHHVHIDVHFVPPGPERLHYTLITSGMSDRPMNAPPGAEEYRYAELMLCLPADWDLGTRETPQSGSEVFKDENSYWPVRWLKRLSRLPHEFNTWLGLAHTIPNGNPAEPLADGSPFTGFMLCEPLIPPPEFQRLEVSPDKTIQFYAIVPLTTAEMDFKLQHGAAALVEKLNAQGVTDLVNPQRRSVV